MPERRFVTSKGDIVFSSLTDSQAAEILAARQESFPRSLAATFKNRGSWSKQQQAWAHKLANEKPDTRPAGHRFPKIAAMFNRAAARGMYPKIKFDSGPMRLVLNRANDQSKYPGRIYIGAGTLANRGKWYGHISPGGDFFRGPHCTDAVLAFLVKLESDPAGVAAAYGRETGSCCFCTKRLTNEISVSVGYGPICAERFGLPWGEVPQADIE